MQLTVSHPSIHRVVYILSMVLPRFVSVDQSICSTLSTVLTSFYQGCLSKERTPINQRQNDSESISLQYLCIEKYTVPKFDTSMSKEEYSYIVLLKIICNNMTFFSMMSNFIYQHLTELLAVEGQHLLISTALKIILGWLENRAINIFDIRMISFDSVSRLSPTFYNQFSLHLYNRIMYLIQQGVLL